MTINMLKEQMVFWISSNEKGIIMPIIADTYLKHIIINIIMIVVVKVRRYKEVLNKRERDKDKYFAPRNSDVFVLGTDFI